jgi:hypothetical protein
MTNRNKVTEPEKLALLYERFQDVCLVEKEVWKEIYLPREISAGPVRTTMHDCYDVEIDDVTVEDTLDASIPRGSAAVAAVIAEYRAHISFFERSS